MLFRFDDLDRSFDFINQLQRRLDSALAQVGVTDVPRAEHSGWADLENTETELVLRADLPGVTDEGMELSLHDEVLTLTAQRAVRRPEGYDKVHVNERRAFKFTRSFSLPARVDPERVGARLVNGILTVRMAKTEALKPRQISISHD